MGLYDQFPSQIANMQLPHQCIISSLFFGLLLKKLHEFVTNFVRKTERNMKLANHCEFINVREGLNA